MNRRNWMHCFALLQFVVVAFLSHFTTGRLLAMQDGERSSGVITAENFKTLPGFEVDMVYQVNNETQGSWVSMCVDLKGRLIVSDQYGKLYRVNVGSDPTVQVTELQANVGMAQGLLHTEDGLYVSINGDAGEGAGVYRLRDTNGDDQFDRQERLIPLNAGGEHGPHAIIPGPDGRLYFCAGNATTLPEKIDRTRMPTNWGEDHLLGRMPDSRGFMTNKKAPGGFILSFMPDGSDIQLVATGFRNEYDIAFNEDGELFSYDADMEWDIGTPWYRPTRVNHVISGAEFGWRNGTGKWPAYYADSFGSVVDIGPGSPTGICFGTGTQFPRKYQDALFIGDWSYGTIYAVHMSSQGASYAASFEPFVSAAPLPVTDMVVHPDQGCLYFLVGGRRAQSALYRVRYTASDASSGSPEPANPEPTNVAQDAANQRARELRREIEAFHLAGPSDEAVRIALKHLGSEDRAIRFAARIALEKQPVASWRDRVWESGDARSTIIGAVALARQGEPGDIARIHDELLSIDFGELDESAKIDLIRAYQLSFTRLGFAPGDEAVFPYIPSGPRMIEQLEPYFGPGSSSAVKRELGTLLIFLQAPGIVGRCVELLEQSPAYEEQIRFAMDLRAIPTGWTPELRERYSRWFRNVSGARGGASFGGFVDNIRKAAIEQLSESEKQSLGDMVEPMVANTDLMIELSNRKFVREWTTQDAFTALQETEITPDFELGRSLFATAQCYKCHRFAGAGGIQGPDLTAAGTRFSDLDLLTAIIEPNREISDQYQSTQFVCEERIVVGRVANLNGNGLNVVTNLLDPGNFTNIDRDEIVEMIPSKISLMPSALLDTFTAEEIAQLLVFIKSSGDPDYVAYQVESTLEE